MKKEMEKITYHVDKSNVDEHAGSDKKEPEIDSGHRPKKYTENHTSGTENA